MSRRCSVSGRCSVRRSGRRRRRAGTAKRRRLTDPNQHRRANDRAGGRRYTRTSLNRSGGEKTPAVAQEEAVVHEPACRGRDIVERADPVGAEFTLCEELEVWRTERNLGRCRLCARGASRWSLGANPHRYDGYRRRRGNWRRIVELPPQLSNSVVITKAKNGAITKHLFCHIKHPAMPWRLLRCQGASRENQTNLIAPARKMAHATQKERRADFETITKLRWMLPAEQKERRASREGGGSPMPACSWPALRRTSFRLPGGVSNRSASGDDCQQIRA